MALLYLQQVQKYTQNSVLCVTPHTSMMCCLQYRHLITAPVDRTSGSAWLHKHSWMICENNKPSTSMTHISLRIKATFSCGVIHASMPRKQGSHRACGRVFCQDVQAFSAVIKYQHCICQLTGEKLFMKDITIASLYFLEGELG